MSARPLQRAILATCAGLPAAVIIFIVAAVANAPLTPTADGQDRAPRLIFERRAIDFGQVTQGEVAKLVYKFRNAGSGTLNITRIRPACGCTIPTLKKRRFDFGQEGAIEVDLDTHGRAGFIEKTLAIESNDPSEPRIILTVKGKIWVPPRPVIALEPELLELGRPSTSRPVPFSFTLRNPGQRRLDVSMFRPAYSVVWIDPPPWSLPPKAALLIRGEVLFGEATGALETSAYLKSNDPNRAVTPLRFRAYRPPPVGARLEFNRPFLSLGALAVGAESERRLSVINRGDAPFHIRSLDAGPGLRVRSSSPTIGLGEEAVITVSIGPVAAGDPGELLRRTLVVQGDGASQSLPVRAYLRPGKDRPKFQGEVRVSDPRPLTWELGDLVKPRYVEANIRIVNDSKSAITIPRVPAAPEGFSVQRLSRQDQLAPGDSVLIEVSARGKNLAEVLDLRWQLPLGSKSLELSIIGGARGNRGALLSAPERLDLGDLPSDTPRDIPIPFENLGSEALEVRDISAYGFEKNRGLELGKLATMRIPAGGRVVLPVRFLGRSRLGLLTATINIGVQDPRRPRRSIAISAWVVPPKAARTLRILYHSDEAGEIEPCGCGGKEQLGGLPRLASAVRARELPGATLKLSAGDLAGGSGELYFRRAGAAARILSVLDYAAMAPGELDLALGPDVLKRRAEAAGLPLVCANLIWKGRSLFPPYRIVERSGAKIAVIGLIDPALAAAARIPGLEARRAVDRLREVLGELKGRVDLRVVLAHTGTAGARQIAAQVDGIDVLVIGHGERVMERGRKIDSARLVSAPDAGKRLGVLDLYLKTGSPISQEGSSIPLDASIEDDPTAAAILARYRRGLRELAPPVLPAPSPGQRYAGDAACRDCHEEETAVYKASLHAFAMESLEPTSNDYDPKCTSCHTVGQGRPGGFTRRDLTPRLIHVQCESCHGPGAAHADDPRMDDPKVGVAMPSLGGEESCRSCHNGQHSPNFRWETYWRRIAHGPKARLEIWDRNKNGLLDVEEEDQRREAIAAEARNTEKRRGGAH